MSLSKNRKLTIDFETRSAIDLTKVGAYRYAVDPSTQVICLAFKFDDEKETYLWHRRIDPKFSLETASPEILPQTEDKYLERLFEYIDSGCEIEAHNAMFEFCVWQQCLIREFPQFPNIDLKNIRCSAAKAAILSLPRSLDGLAHAILDGMEKDKQGRAIMLKMCKPRKLTKKQLKGLEQYAGIRGYEVGFVGDYVTIDGEFIWHQTLEDCQKLFKYCKQDVDVEHACSKVIPDLSEKELSIFQMDFHMNLHGILIDWEYVKIALNLIHDITNLRDKKLNKITSGKVDSGRSRNQVLQFIQDDLKYHLPDLTKDTLESVLKKPDLPATVKEIIHIRQDVSRTSNAKYTAMKVMRSSDNRIRNTFLYSGASATTRWAGRLLQVQNFPRGEIKSPMGEMCAAVIMFGRSCPELLDSLYGNTMLLLSSTLRGCIIPPPKKDLIVADYVGVESRVLIWLANCLPGLKIFADGLDIYLQMAAEIYGISYDKAAAEYDGGQGDGTKRFYGKQAILGLGYQMGYEKFFTTLLKYGAKGITKSFAKEVVRIYREVKFPEIPDLWHRTEKSAKKALLNRGQKIVQKINEKQSLIWVAHGHFLYCALPSGARLHYYKPKLILTKTSWGAEKYSVSYLSTNSVTGKFERTLTYGGKFVENIVQKIARDLMASGMLNTYRSQKYFPIMPVHDELVSEVNEGEGDVEEYNELLCRLEPWAEGIPLKAEGTIVKRYTK